MLNKLFIFALKFTQFSIYSIWPNSRCRERERERTALDVDNWSIPLFPRSFSDRLRKPKKRIRKKRNFRVPRNFRV